MQAAGELLLALLPSDETVEPADVDGVSPQAVQILVQAEREFHSGRFERALELYSAAVQEDSTFALAGARGAQAASWKHKQEEAINLIEITVANVEQLAPRWAHFARGFDAHLQARADNAVYHFEQAIAHSETWAEGWMGLAETYQHLLPRKTPQDSLARAGFEEVYRRKPGYVPALYHLAEFAMREGDLDGADSLLLEYRAADPEEDVLANLELALACVLRSPGAIDWRHHVLEDANRVYQAAKLLGVGGAHPECAMAGWQAVLDYDTTTSENYLFGSLMGLQSMLVATGSSDRLRVLLDSAAASGSRTGQAGLLSYIVDALVGADVEAQAQAVADSLRHNLDSLSEPRLWYLAVWDSHRGRVDEAVVVRDSLRSLAGRGSQRAALMADALTAHVDLARGDTARALDLLGNLEPTGQRSSYQNPWESLGFERIALARLLYVRSDYEAAYRIAATLDSPCAASVIYPVFLPASLELRLRAAEGVGNRRLAEQLRERLRKVGREDLVDSPVVDMPSARWQ